jgi:hypothetical protein
VQGPVFTKKTTSHIERRRKKATMYRDEAGIRKIINKTDFEIQILEAAKMEARALKQQGLKGDSVEFWVIRTKHIGNLALFLWKGTLC